MRFPDSGGLGVCCKTLENAGIADQSEAASASKKRPRPAEFSDSDSASDDSEVEVVEVYFVQGQEIDSRTGPPWGMTQEQFDAKQMDFQQSKLKVALAL